VEAYNINKELSKQSPFSDHEPVYRIVSITSYRKKRMVPKKFFDNKKLKTFY
jgi:hypothetical protein